MAERRVKWWAVAAAVWFVVAVEVGGVLADATAWALAVVWFAFGCLLLAAFVRWLYT